MLKDKLSIGTKVSTSCDDDVIPKNTICRIVKNNRTNWYYTVEDDNGNDMVLPRNMFKVIERV